jgi:hypothetical protein
MRGGGVTVNFYGNVNDPQMVARMVGEGVRQAGRAASLVPA